jgi:hypothetical protein
VVNRNNMKHCSLEEVLENCYFILFITGYCDWIVNMKDANSSERVIRIGKCSMFSCQGKRG